MSDLWTTYSDLGGVGCIMGWMDVNNHALVRLIPCESKKKLQVASSSCQEKQARYRGHWLSGHFSKLMINSLMNGLAHWLTGLLARCLGVCMCVCVIRWLLIMWDHVTPWLDWIAVSDSTMCVSYVSSARNPASAAAAGLRPGCHFTATGGWSHGFSGLSIWGLVFEAWVVAI